MKDDLLPLLRSANHAIDRNLRMMPRPGTGVSNEGVAYHVMVQVGLMLHAVLVDAEQAALSTPATRGEE